MYLKKRKKNKKLYKKNIKIIKYGKFPKILTYSTKIKSSIIKIIVLIYIIINIMENWEKFMNMLNLDFYNLILNLIYKMMELITEFMKIGSILLTHPSATSLISVESIVKELSSSVKPSCYAREEDIKSRVIKSIIFIYFFLKLFLIFFNFFKF